MKEHKLVFLEPDVDDLCYLLGQAISRLLEEGHGVQTNHQANSAEPTDDDSSSEHQQPEA